MNFFIILKVGEYYQLSKMWDMKLEGNVFQQKSSVNHKHHVQCKGLFWYTQHQ